MTERIEFVLPYPPTVNTYWRRRGSTYFVSKAGERYRRDVALIVRQQRLKLNLSGRLAIKIIGVEFYSNTFLPMDQFYPI